MYNVCASSETAFCGFGALYFFLFDKRHNSWKIKFKSETLLVLITYQCNRWYVLESICLTFSLRPSDERAKYVCENWKQIFSRANEGIIIWFLVSLIFAFSALSVLKTIQIYLLVLTNDFLVLLLKIIVAEI